MFHDDEARERQRLGKGVTCRGVLRGQGLNRYGHTGKIKPQHALPPGLYTPQDFDEELESALWS